MLRKLVMATTLTMLALPAMADAKFKADSAELAAFKAQGEPAVFVSRIGDGPEGMTLRGNNNDVLEAYISSK